MDVEQQLRDVVADITALKNTASADLQSVMRKLYDLNAKVVGLQLSVNRTADFIPLCIDFGNALNAGDVIFDMEGWRPHYGDRIRELAAERGCSMCMLPGVWQLSTVSGPLELEVRIAIQGVSQRVFVAPSIPDSINLRVVASGGIERRWSGSLVFPISRTAARVVSSNMESPPASLIAYPPTPELA